MRNCPKKLSFFLVLVLISAVFFGCGPEKGETPEAEPILLKYTNAVTTDHISTRFAYRWSELLEERTNGRVKLDIFPNSSLGTLDEQVQGLGSGVIDIVHNDFAGLAKLMPELAVVNVPYLFKDFDQAAIATNPRKSPPLQEINEKFIEKTGIRILGGTFYGARNLTANFPVKLPDDLANKKIRAVPIPLFIATVEGMGAVPTPVDFSELPTALATGVVDGQENPLQVIYNNHLYEVQDYVMKTEHMLSMLGVFINDKKFNSLSEEDQKILIETFDEANAENLKIGLSEESDVLERLKEEGMTVIAEEDGLDNEAFKKAVLASINQMFPEWAEYITRFSEIQ